MKKTALTLGLLVAALSPYAEAKEAPYAGVDVSMVNLNTSTGDISPIAIRLRVGTELAKYLGIEFQTAVGIQDDDAAVAGGTLTGSLSNVSGAYLRSQLPLGDAISVYGTLGYAWSRIEIQSQVPGLVGNTASDSDVSAGVGAEIKIMPHSYLSLDYMEYSDGLTAISFGIRVPL